MDTESFQTFNSTLMLRGTFRVKSMRQHLVWQPRSIVNHLTLQLGGGLCQYPQSKNCNQYAFQSPCIVGLSSFHLRCKWIHSHQSSVILKILKVRRNQTKSLIDAITSYNKQRWKMAYAISLTLIPQIQRCYRI